MGTVSPLFGAGRVAATRAPETPAFSIVEGGEDRDVARREFESQARAAQVGMAMRALDRAYLAENSFTRTLSDPVQDGDLRARQARLRAEVEVNVAEARRLLDELGPTSVGSAA